VPKRIAVFRQEEEIHRVALRSELARFNAFIGEPHLATDIDGKVVGYWNISDGVMVIESGADGKFSSTKARFFSRDNLDMIQQVREVDHTLDLEFGTEI
tara:strand:- start:4543 stop:4839 length:297 start_codon:yes stop_codon:yes gene_type:complete